MLWQYPLGNSHTPKQEGVCSDMNNNAGWWPEFARFGSTWFYSTTFIYACWQPFYSLSPKYLILENTGKTNANDWIKLYQADSNKFILFKKRKKPSQTTSLSNWKGFVLSTKLQSLFHHCSKTPYLHWRGPQMLEAFYTNSFFS